MNPFTPRLPAFARLLLLCALALPGAMAPAQAGTVQVAVAANFAAPAKQLAAEFKQATGHEALVSVGSTGALYAQVRNGAPFEVFMSADEETPAKLEQEGLAVAGQRRVYAIGRLVLWSAQPNLVDAKGEVLKTDAFKRLAVANPKVAPYGQAAEQTLRSLGLLDRLKPKWVQGENIAQTHQFVQSGNAELGFVALSQVMQAGKLVSGSAWVVPAHLHEPLTQAVTLLVKGQNNPAAKAWLDYLQSNPAQTAIQQAGYER